ncbi:MAG: hypothetical protein KGL39_52130 [Patescibacteria group bacterium]|nr:hypothetical protein [Patescibacteria group bacterium]
MKNEKIEAFLALVRDRIYKQYEYDCTKNVECGVTTLAEAQTGENAIKCGLVSAVGHLVKWSVEDAIEIAADILEDVNAHPEAAELRAKIGK